MSYALCLTRFRKFIFCAFRASLVRVRSCVTFRPRADDAKQLDSRYHSKPNSDLSPDELARWKARLNLPSPEQRASNMNSRRESRISPRESAGGEGSVDKVVVQKEYPLPPFLVNKWMLHKEKFDIGGMPRLASASNEAFKKSEFLSQKEKRVRQKIKSRIKKVRSDASTYRNPHSFREQVSTFPNCPYCFQPFPCALSDDIHLEHIYPVSAGGESLPENMIFICKTCNQVKTDKGLSEFCISTGRDLVEISRVLRFLGKLI